MRKAEGYRRLAAARGGTVCERVWWATGSCTRDGCSLGVGDGFTLGGGTTLGGGAAAGVADGGASVVLVFQWAKRSQILDIFDSCLLWIAVEASLAAQDKFFRACTILSFGSDPWLGEVVVDYLDGVVDDD